jgi:hypothetical protein
MGGLGNIVHIAAGSLHGVALKEDGTLLAWGKNNNCQLGNGSNTDSDNPVAVKDLKIKSGVVSGGNMVSTETQPGIKVDTKDNKPAAPALKPPAQNPVSDTTKGNTNGNLQNGGYAARQGDYIYYANPADQNKLYRIK